MSCFKLSAACLGCVMSISIAAAQPAQQPGAGRPGAGNAPVGAAQQRGVSGVGVSAQYRPDQLNAIKELLKCEEQEWASLAPLIEQAVIAKQNMNSGAGMSWSASSINAKPNIQPSTAKPNNPCGEAMQKVREASNESTSTDDDLNSAITALREARLQAREAYDAAQKSLLEALTPRQQAILITLGVVE